MGEKIGGARKDTALSTGKSKKTKSNDDRPTWAKRYSNSEIVSSTNSNESGKWVIEDSKKTDWKGSPKKLGMFDSEQEAKDMLPVVAVGLKHRVCARRDGERTKRTTRRKWKTTSTPIVTGKQIGRASCRERV